MSDLLIALVKNPGILLAGFKETWRRIFERIVIKFTGPEATMACQDEHMCNILKTVIEDAVHGVQAI